ncbi:hypothetical protein [Formosa sp. S-31]|uniref:hypothetical protein n=1 Tax=Formosa sp. S-31 TaxID=2790949 RepID=UPI003EB782E4
MKTLYYIHRILIACVLALVVQSCDENDFDDPIPNGETADKMSWQATTILKVSTDSDSNAFVWQKNLVTLEESWQNNEVVLHLDLNTNLPVNQIDKIQFYINAEEKDGYNAAAPYDKANFLLETIDSFNEELSFDLHLSASKVYDLFKNKYEFDRQTSLVREGDIFEIKWAIFAKDGTVLDTRNSTEINKRFGFQSKIVDVIPPVWVGDFSYEILTATANAQYYGYVKPGDSGTISITESNTSGVYNVQDLSFFFYGAAYSPGELTYDFTTGEISTKDVGSYRYAAKWEITKVDGPSIEILWSYYYSSGYDIYMTVKLTRNDGDNWPTNLHTN